MVYTPSLQTQDFDFDAPENYEQELAERDYDSIYDEEREENYED